MPNHQLLDNITHKNLKVNRRFEPGGGFDYNVARVFPVELSVAQREYPLFFLKNAETGDFDTIALLGFDKEENLYLQDDGWAARYLPLSIERQPFLIGFQEQEQDGVPTQVPVVHVDIDHPSVSDDEGIPVFLPQGGESPFLERINSVLKAVHDGHAASREFSQVLEGLELIEPLEVNVEFNDGSKQTLTGLYTISEDRFRALTAEALETLHQGRHLQSIFMMLASLPVFDTLIEKKNRLLTAGQ